MESFRKIRNKVNALNVLLKKKHYTNMVSACKGNMSLGNQLMNFSKRDQNQVALIVSKNLAQKF